MQIWYQCKTGRSWGYVATGHHKTKRDIAWYSTQQELSWSGILIHTTPFELLQTFAACVLNSIESPPGPWVCLEFSLSGSAWGYAPNVSTGGAGPPKFSIDMYTELGAYHASHTVGCLMNGWVAAQGIRKTVTFLCDKPASTHPGIKRKGKSYYINHIKSWYTSTIQVWVRDMSSQHWDWLADGSIASAVAEPPHKTSMGLYLVASASVDLNCHQGDA